MHDWSKEIEQMESQWEKRRNAQDRGRIDFLKLHTYGNLLISRFWAHFWPRGQADKRYMEAEEAKAKLEMESNTIPDRLATKLNVDYDLIGPIEADRGDPYALQVSKTIF